MSLLFTGGRGASKTLNSITELVDNEFYNQRPLYVYGVNKFKCDKFTQITSQPAQYLTKEQLLDWKSHVPRNSVIFVDEVQEVWPQRPTGSKVPKGVFDMAQSREEGIDFVFTCQFPTQLDINIRKLCDTHRHLERKFGTKMVQCYEWQNRVESIPPNYFAKQESTKSTKTIKSKYFDLYESADQHHIKSRLPNKLFYFLAFFLVIAFVIYKIPSMLFDNKTSAADSMNTSPISDIQDVVKGNLKSVNSSNALQTETMSLEDYLYFQKPLVPDQPWSAPQYHHLMEAKVRPYPNCYSYERNNRVTCKCVSQQGTKMAISQEICLYYMANGYDFDPTREPSQPYYSQSDASRDISTKVDHTATPEPTVKPLTILPTIKSEMACETCGNGNAW